MINIILYSLISVISIVASFLLCFTNKHIINIFQLFGYNEKKLINWVHKNNKKTIITHLINTGVIFMYVLVFSIIFSIFKIHALLKLLVSLSVINISLLNIKKIKNTTFKKPLVYTNRVKRLFTTYGLINFIFSFLTLYLCTMQSVFFGLFLAFIYGFQYLIILLSNNINKPVEKSINYSYILKAKKKLSENKHLTIIGITGSFGKTSVKFIITQILKEKYFTLCTPNSYNTPLGITKTILNYLKPHHEIFVVEMGADHVNDINKICKIVKPKISILTNIGSQHLQTFKTLDNIIKTKYQIVKNTDSTGFSVFNINNVYVNELYCQTRIKKIGVNYNDKTAQVYASNIKVSVEGLEFFVNYNKQRFKLKTKLLGEHNITNILLAVAVALELKVDVKSIKNAVEKLQPTKSRLELVKLLNGAYILDDSFNCNPSGCETALKVLSYFENKIKIIITPGMVELGEKQFEENYKFGQLMSKVADLVYVVNKVNKEALISGLIDNGFNENNIKYYDSFNLAFNDVKQILTNNHILLIENDLPDNYD